MSTITAKKERVHAAAWKMTPGKFLEYFFMYLFAAVCLIPLIWMVRTAFIPHEYELKLFQIAAPTLDNFTNIWNQAPWLSYYGNTLFVVGSVLIMQYITITMAGYAFARLDFYGKNTLFMLFLTQIMIAADVLILPNYMTISAMGMANTLIGTAMPFFASANSSERAARSCSNSLFSSKPIVSSIFICAIEPSISYCARRRSSTRSLPTVYSSIALSGSNPLFQSFISIVYFSIHQVVAGILRHPPPPRLRGQIRLPYANATTLQRPSSAQASPA